MNEQDDITTILDNCLDALLSGEQSIDDCLARYPDHAAELQPALQAAQLTNRLKKPEMDASSVSALEMRLRDQMLAQQARPVRTRRNLLAPYSKLAAMIAIAFLLALGAGGGAVAASANTVPGDFLYPVKRFWEAIILALSSLNESTDDVWLQLAETRLDEAESLAGRGALDPMILIDVYEATAQAMILADAETAPRVIAYLKDAEMRVSDLPVQEPTHLLRSDLLLLVEPSDSGSLRVPEAMRPPSLSLDVSGPTSTLTATPTLTETPSPTLTHTSSPTASFTPTQTSTPSLTPTSRVPATATDTPPPTRTPVPTHTLTATPTLTWTPLPLPGDNLESQTGSPPNDSGTARRATSTPRPTLNLTATIRYRDTQAAIYATQTALPAVETEEVRP